MRLCLLQVASRRQVRQTPRQAVSWRSGRTSPSPAAGAPGSLQTSGAALGVLLLVGEGLPVICHGPGDLSRAQHRLLRLWLAGGSEYEQALSEGCMFNQASAVTARQLTAVPERPSCKQTAPGCWAGWTAAGGARALQGQTSSPT